MNNRKDFFSAYPIARALTGQQREAVSCGEGPVLLYAVPGSGKTTVLLSRVAYLTKEKQVPPAKILAITFTVAATRDMRRKYEEFFGKESGKEQPVFCTIHELCRRIVRAYCEIYHREHPPVFPDQKNGVSRELDRLLRAILVQKGIEKNPNEATLEVFRGAISRCKNLMLQKEQMEKVRVVGYPGADFFDVFETYEKQKRERQLYDYDDELVYAYRILNRFSPVLSAFQNRYCYFFLDEAQDTSFIQHRILGLLASRSRNLFLVGDDDQSIYGFRAAYPEEMLLFSSTYPDARVFTLSENFRSSANIVKAAGNFIGQNRVRREKKMMTRNETGDPIRVVRLSVMQKQYERILRLTQEEGGTTAVLYRNHESVLPLLCLFEEKGIEYTIRDANRFSTFFSGSIVRDMMNVLTLALFPQDTECFLACYYKFSYFTREMARSAVAQTQSGRYSSVLEAADAVLRQNGKPSENFRNLFFRISKMTPDKAVFSVREWFDFDAREAEFTGVGAETVAYKMEILSCLASQFQTLRAFVAFSKGEEPHLDAAVPDASVTFSTIHSAKGREFDRVILMDAYDGILPGEEDSEEEERRLFYVAATRAKKQLIFVCCKACEDGTVLPRAGFVEEFIGRKL